MASRAMRDEAMDKTTQSFPRTKTSEGKRPQTDDFETMMKMEQGRYGEYRNEEDDLICARFPHLDFCSCTKDKALNEYLPVQVEDIVFSYLSPPS